MTANSVKEFLKNSLNTKNFTVAPHFLETGKVVILKKCIQASIIFTNLRNLIKFT